MKISAFPIRFLSTRVLAPGLAALLLGCDNDIPEPEALPAADPPSVQWSSADNPHISIAAEQPEPEQLPPSGPRSLGADAKQPQFSVDDNPYVFDVSKHSQEELLAALKRADEIATASSEDFKKFNLAIIVHGPDVSWFDKRHYEQNKELVDLAAKLDALDVINMKIDQESMAKHGILDENVPTFIDRVPFAADELTRLQDSGYFTF